MACLLSLAGRPSTLLFSASPFERSRALCLARVPCAHTVRGTGPVCDHNSQQRHFTKARYGAFYLALPGATRVLRANSHGFQGRPHRLCVGTTRPPATTVPRRPAPIVVTRGLVMATLDDDAQSARVVDEAHRDKRQLAQTCSCTGTCFSWASRASQLSGLCGIRRFAAESA